MRSPDVNTAKLKAIQNARMVRKIGAFGYNDATVLEDMMTGERRTVPNKWLLMAGKLEVAFEMAPAPPPYDADYPDDE